MIPLKIRIIVSIFDASCVATTSPKPTVDIVTTTKYIAEDTGSASSWSADTMTTSAIIYEMYWDGSTLNYYVDGAYVAAISAAANIPTGALRPSICFRTGSANARQCDIYWWRVIQIGQ